MEQAERGDSPGHPDTLLPSPLVAPDDLVARLEEEQRTSWRSGERVRVPDYLERFPTLASDPDAVVDLIYNEFLLREQYGETPRWEEYFERFPHLADRLRDQREVHEAVPLLSRGAAGSRGGWGTRPTAPGPESTEPPSRLLAIPGYEILGELGRGGTGVVYQARQLKPNRVVALKMLRAGIHADEFDSRRFQAEAETLARVQHPAIVQVYEVGEYEGQPFFSLEFCPGGSLARRLGGVPMQPGEAAALAEGLARAMHAAHGQGVVHRDLKPANILLTAQGEVKITDFGLAKRLDVDLEQTRSGTIVGTPSYMAPEQATGRTRQIGLAADVYALGAILYELLTGRPPFRGASVLDTLQQVACDEPVPPGRLQPKVPHDLETICLKCLAKAPAKRYGDALALAEDLQRFLRGEPIRARRTPLWERGLKWVRREPATAGLLLASVVAVLALVGALTTLAINARLAQERQTLEQLNRDLEQAQQDLEQAQQSRERDHYFHRILLADRERSAGRWRTAERLLDDCPQQLRGWEWDFLKRLCHRDLAMLDEHERRYWSLVFSPDGLHLILGGPGGRVGVQDLAGSRVKDCFALGTPVSALAFSPDGERVALAGDGRILVRASVTGRELGDVPARSGPVQTIAFSPLRGGPIAFADRDGVKVWNLVRANLSNSFPEPIRVNGLAFSPDGETIASAGGDGIVKVWNATTGGNLVVFNGRAGPVHGVAFSPDGKYIAAAHERRKVTVWDRLTGKQLRTLEGHAEAVRTVAFSPDGRRIASGSRDKTVVVWDSATGEALLTLTGHTTWVHALAFSPDGTRIASTSVEGRVLVQDVAPHLEFRHLGRGTLVPQVSCLAFHPGSRLLASAGADHTVRIWNAETGQEIQKLERVGQLASIAFSPDGRYCILVSPNGSVRVQEVSVAQDKVRFTDKTRFNVEPFGPRAVAVSPDFQQIASAMKERVRVQEIPDRRQPPRSFPGPDRRPVCGVAFSPDGKRIASASGGGGLKVHELADGTEPFSLTGHPPGATCIAFSPDGQRLASGGMDGKVKLHDAATGQELLTIPAHASAISGLAFTPDSQRIVSVGGDNLLKILDALTGQEALTLSVSGGAASCVALSPDGRYLAAGGSDGVRLWWR
jgi:WD40 repeat protein/serine/threonine protein kinase